MKLLFKTGDLIRTIFDWFFDMVEAIFNQHKLVRRSIFLFKAYTNSVCEYHEFIK